MQFLHNDEEEHHMPQRILVVEDETEIANYLKRGLMYEGFTVDVVGDGNTALAMAREHSPDLVVLDRMLPGLDGIEVAKRLRAGLNTPIIMLTVRDAVADRVEGLESGADDYLSKPFAFEELLARIRVQLRRQHAQQTGEVLRIGPLVLKPAAHEVRVNDRVVELTAKEFEVLELFMRHPQQVLTREVIYDRVWGYDFGNDSNVIEVYIRALRQKLEINNAPRLLHTVRGVGYVLREND